MFNPKGRVFFVLTGEGREPGKTDAEKAALLNTRVACAGTCRLEDGKCITKVEVA